MMNTNKYGLEYAGPRRARRGALRQWLIDLVIGAAAMALLWWLFSLVSRAATKGDVMPGLRAGMPASWVAFGVFLLSLAGVVLWARARGRVAENAEDAWDPYAGSKPMPFEIVDPLAEGDTLKREQRAIEAMPAGVTRLDVALICFALASETRLIRELVRGAQRSLGAEDYGDALAGAERRLGDLRTRLWQLKAHFDGGQICARDADDLPRSYGAAAKMTNAGGRP